MNYQCETIKLVPFTREYFKEPYTTWFDDPDVTRYNSHSLFPYTEKRKKAFLEAIESDSTEMIVWAILYKIMPEDLPDRDANGKALLKEIHIGNCAIQSINWVNRSAELAFVLGDNNYWGKGVATQAGQFMLEHAFDKLGMHRVWTGTADTNIGMQKVTRHLNMSYEGEFRDGVWLNGVYNNVFMYSILDYEYFSHKGIIHNA
jgi:RimJ/RimL family protein N-acetyltransferase